MSLVKAISGNVKAISGTGDGLVDDALLQAILKRTPESPIQEAPTERSAIFTHPTTSAEQWNFFSAFAQQAATTKQPSVQVTMYTTAGNNKTRTEQPAIVTCQGHIQHRRQPAKQQRSLKGNHPYTNIPQQQTMQPNHRIPS